MEEDLAKLKTEDELIEYLQKVCKGDSGKRSQFYTILRDRIKKERYFKIFKIFCYNFGSPKTELLGIFDDCFDEEIIEIILKSRVGIERYFKSLVDNKMYDICQRFVDYKTERTNLFRDLTHEEIRYLNRRLKNTEHYICNRIFYGSTREIDCDKLHDLIDLEQFYKLHLHELIYDFYQRGATTLLDHIHKNYIPINNSILDDYYINSKGCMDIFKLSTKGYNVMRVMEDYITKNLLKNRVQEWHIDEYKKILNSGYIVIPIQRKFKKGESKRAYKFLIENGFIYNPE